MQSVVYICLQTIVVFIAVSRFYSMLVLLQVGWQDATFVSAFLCVFNVLPGRVGVNLRVVHATAELQGT